MTVTLSVRKNRTELIGYVVLTEQAVGGYQPDWDGELHQNVERGEEELRAATEALGHAVLAEVRVLAHGNRED